MRPFAFLFALLIALVSISATTFAQDAEPSTPASPAELSQLLETLKDDQKRAEFVEQLEALVAAQQAVNDQAGQSFGGAILRTVAERMDAVGAQLAELGRDLSNLPGLVQSMTALVNDIDERNAGLLLAVQLVLILLAGIVAERIAKRLLRRFHASIESQEPESLVVRIFFAVLRAVLDFIAVAAFLAGAYAMMTVTAPANAGRVLALALINASVIARIVLTIAKLCLAPRVNSMRLILVGDETANYLLVWTRRIVYVAAYGLFVVEALPALGASASLYAIASKAVGFTLTVMVIVLIMQTRRDVAEQIARRRERSVGQLLQRLADIWHLIAILYVIGIFGVWALEVPGGFDFVFQSTITTIVLLIVAFALTLLIQKAMRKGFSITDEQKARYPGLEERANRYLPFMLRGSRIVIYAIAFLAVLSTWGVDVVGWATTPTGIEIAKSIANIAMIIVVALLVWEGISFAIERYLRLNKGGGTPDSTGQRAMTLLPLLRNVVLVALAVLVTLTVLSELGVDIGPLIAGAGIIGLAVGFGAQTFVKDVITGFFILIEDSVAVGDLVVLGGYRGKVESMSLRSIQLRDVRGDVHRIPFSEVTSTTNRSKVFSFAFFDIGVAYREDVDHCMNVIREVGAEMRADEKFAPMILEDIEIMGLEAFGDSAIVIRARIKVVPGKHLGVQRAYNRLLKNRFDAEGIEIPFPHQTIYFGVDSDGNAPPAHILMQQPRTGAPKRPKATLHKEPEGEGADFEEEPIVEEEPKEKS